jgi:hypothetical protein
MVSKGCQEKPRPGKGGDQTLRLKITYEEEAGILSCFLILLYTLRFAGEFPCPSGNSNPNMEQLRQSCTLGKQNKLIEYSRKEGIAIDSKP